MKRMTKTGKSKTKGQDQYIIRDTNDGRIMACVSQFCDSLKPGSIMTKRMAEAHLAEMKGLPVEMVKFEQTHKGSSHA